MAIDGEWLLIERLQSCAITAARKVSTASEAPEGACGLVGNYDPPGPSSQQFAKVFIPTDR